MELKQYQKRVIADLSDYLSQLNGQPTLAQAFSAYWCSRQITVGTNGIPGYHSVIDGVPHVCYKVPTGGGKTFLACASVKPIFHALPPTRKKAVVWLVPTDSILTQTLATLKDPAHPYRRKLNADFSGRVEVYSKEELLAGQNFSPASVAEQLSVMVLSYDSFRARSKDGRKAYQANGNLAAFATAFGTPDQPIANADETALFQVINQLNPVVIVDESHHATSTLSHEMLSNFNPAFILDLTATPKQQANIISYVDALSLKNEHMVKLPVIAYNRSSQTEVITDAIDLRQNLEAAATQQFAATGRYIRPIVLFQAQPKTNEDATSFERLRDKLVKAGIPANQIAIKTANINELKGVDLLSPQCQIRFIITVNALKEGWDCPFAYILASLANKTSQIDVQQILGRVLRQPYAMKQPAPLLNMSYVLTSSSNFNDALTHIIDGLNNAGFTRRDLRSNDALTMGPPVTESVDADTEEFLNFDEDQVSSKLAERQHGSTETRPDESTGGLAPMLQQAQQQGSEYEQEAETSAKFGNYLVPQELENAVETIKVNPDFADEIAQLRLPQFVIKTPETFMLPAHSNNSDLLNKTSLAEGFVLLNKDIELDLSTVDEQMFRIDVTAKGSIPQAFRMSALDQRIMREHFAHLSIEGQKRQAAEAIYQRIKPINTIADSDVREYIRRVVNAFGTEELVIYREHPRVVADKIKEKINGLLDEHAFKKFYQEVETRQVDVINTFVLLPVIQPPNATSLIGGSLYEAEGEMNRDEIEFAGRFSSLENVRWWHRNLVNGGFYINGPINHYPDFIVMTTKGTIVIVEPKGEQLKNDDSKRKLRLGRTWADMSGNRFRYYMVFQDGVTPLEGAVDVTGFLRILEHL